VVRVGGEGSGKKSLAEKILEDLEDEEDEEGGFLICYDFKEKPRTPFYKNLERLFSSLEGGSMIQKSVVSCRRLKTALAIRALAEHYGAEVKVFRAEEID